MTAVEDEPDLTVAEVSTLTGLSEHTLRYYERAELVGPVPRRPNGQRRYGRHELGGIDFVTKMRRTGMPIRTIRDYVALARRGPSTEPERQRMLLEHRENVRRQLAEIQQALELIEYKIDLYGAGDVAVHAAGTGRQAQVVPIEGESA
jgi:DNA-binding transcriptional MerR regulator